MNHYTCICIRISFWAFLNRVCMSFLKCPACQQLICADAFLCFYDQGILPFNLFQSLSFLFLLCSITEQWRIFSFYVLLSSFLKYFMPFSGAGGLQLVIKPEYSQPEKIPNILIKNHTDPRRQSFSPFKLYCKKCGEKQGGKEGVTPIGIFFFQLFPFSFSTSPFIFHSCSSL